MNLWEHAAVTVKKPGASVCQDSAAAKSLTGELSVLAVADGAGSSSRSDEAANWLTAAAVDVVDRYVANGEMRPGSAPGAAGSVLRHVWREIAVGFVHWRDSQPHPTRDYHSTLTLAVIDLPVVAVARVGDGFVVVQSGNDIVLALPPGGREGEYQNETEFVDERVEPDIAVFFDPNIAMVACSSDGLEKLLEKRRVRNPDGAFGDTPVFWNERPGTHFFDRIRANLVKDTTAAGLKTFLHSDALMALKRDDIGVAVAARQ